MKYNKSGNATFLSGIIGGRLPSGYSVVEVHASEAQLIIETTTGRRLKVDVWEQVDHVPKAVRKS